MPLQILTLKLDGITAGDYLTWCRDPEPPALDYALRSISIDADPLSDTITAILDWSHAPPPCPVAASAAGLPLSTGVQIDATPTERPHSAPLATGTGSRLRHVDVDTEQRLPRNTGVERQLRSAA